MLKSSNFKDIFVLVAIGIALGGVALLILEKGSG